MKDSSTLMRLRKRVWETLTLEAIRKFPAPQDHKQRLSTEKNIVATIWALSPNISPKKLYDCLVHNRYFGGLSYEQLAQIAEQGFFGKDVPGRSTADCEFFENFLSWPEQKEPLSADEVADALHTRLSYKDKTEEELKYYAAYGVWPEISQPEP